MSETYLVLGRCRKKRIQVKIWDRGGSVKCLDGNGTIISYPTPSKIQVSQDIIEICSDCGFTTENSKGVET